MSNIDLNTSLKELLENHLEEVKLFKAEANCNYWKDDYHIHCTITSDKVFKSEDEALEDMREFIVNDMYSFSDSEYDINTYQIAQGNKLLVVKDDE